MEEHVGTLTLPIGRLEAAKKEVESPRGPMKVALQTWERLYRAFVLRRFDAFSRGGGDWRPLSPATIAAKKSRAILVDTRIMRLGLAAGVGVVRTETARVIKLTIGFTNQRQHPRAKMSIADLCRIHHIGLGVPRREILAEPDEFVLSGMRRAAEGALRRTLSR